VADLLLERADELGRVVLAVARVGGEDDVGEDALALDLVREADHRGLGDGSCATRALSTSAVPSDGRTDVDDVVDAAGDPVVAVLVAPAAVAGEVVGRGTAEVGLVEALVVAPDRARLAGPGRSMQRLPLTPLPSISLPSSSTSTGLTPKKGSVAEPGFIGVTPGSGVIRMPPVSVCHQVSTMAQRPLPTFVVVPAPGLGVDGLADRAEHAQRVAA
jgi:hypothetical protein